MEVLLKAGNQGLNVELQSLGKRARLLSSLMGRVLEVSYAGNLPSHNGDQVQ